MSFVSNYAYGTVWWFDPHFSKKPNTSKTEKSGLILQRKTLEETKCCFKSPNDEKRECFLYALKYKDVKLKYVEVEKWTNGIISYDVSQDEGGQIYGECLNYSIAPSDLNCSIFQRLPRKTYIEKAIQALSKARNTSQRIKPGLEELREKFNRKRCCFRERFKNDDNNKNCFIHYLGDPKLELKFLEVKDWTNGHVLFDLKR